MLRTKEYSAFCKVIQIPRGNDCRYGNDAVEIKINFTDIPSEKRNKIEKVAREFLDLAEKILDEDQASELC